MEAVLTQVADGVNSVAAFVYRVLRSQEPLLTLRVAGALFALSILGRICSGLTLFGIAWFLAFTVPK